MKHLFLLYKDFLKLPMELVYYGIVCGEAVKGIFFNLDTDICDAGIFRCGELTLGRGRNSQPVA